MKIFNSKIFLSAFAICVGATFAFTPLAYAKSGWLPDTITCDASLHCSGYDAPNFELDKPAEVPGEYRFVSGKTHPDDHVGDLCPFYTYEFQGHILTLSSQYCVRDYGYNDKVTSIHRYLSWKARLYNGSDLFYFECKSSAAQCSYINAPISLDEPTKTTSHADNAQNVEYTPIYVSNTSPYEATFGFTDWNAAPAVLTETHIPPHTGKFKVGYYLIRPDWAKHLDYSFWVKLGSEPMSSSNTSICLDRGNNRVIIKHDLRHYKTLVYVWGTRDKGLDITLEYNPLGLEKPASDVKVIKIDNY